MEFAVFQAHIAYSAGEKKSPRVMTGATTVIDILKQASCIREDETGRLVAASTQPPGPSQTVISSGIPSETRFGTARIVQGQPPSQEHSLTIAIQIQVQCAPDQLAGLAGQLRALIQNLRASEAETEN
jgi:hypothetical protein